MLNGPSAPSSTVLLKTAGSRRLVSGGLSARVAGLAVLFVSELVVISTWLDTSALDGKSGLVGAVGDDGPYILQSLVVLATVLLALGYANAKDRLRAISNQLEDMPWSWGFLAAHGAAMSAFAFLSSLLFREASHPGTALAVAWLAAGLCGIAAAVFFFVPPRTFRELADSAGSAWIYAAVAGAITPVLVITSKRLWKPATALTFELVKFLLGPFVGTVIAIPATKTLGTQKFIVEIAPSCSGLEGVGLMLVFSLLWLWFFRADYQFPRALAMVPVGVTVIFLLNAVRIAILILIGDAGAHAVALGGFHSQAGWIAFNGVALALAAGTRRVPWFSSTRTPIVTAPLAENPVAPFLMPFLAILAAAMISRAASGTFEWMYPLRFIAAAGTLFYFRRQYASIPWKFGWAAPVAGGLVFILWIALDRVAGPHTESGIPGILAAWPAAARNTWLFFRVLAAVITVPIAEELAFRGFLIRRLISADFESISLQRWTLAAVVISSLAFGMLHGDRWIAGSAAGLLYAAVQKWRGRIGDAVVAHGVTNALISVWVLWGGHWSLW